MKLQFLIQQIYYEPSLITPDAHASIRQLIESRLSHSDIFEAREPGKGVCGSEVEVEQAQVIDGIMHIPINGAIGQKLSPFQRGDGAVDVMDISAELDQAEQDETVQAILLDIDSPGGMVLGTPELADKINRVKKPVYAFTNGMIASAAYWIAASADQIFATPTASIGGIGVYIPWVDQTKAYEMQGLSVELIKAGKLKGMGFPGTSLTNVQRDHLQSRVDSIYSMFTSHVRAMRGDVAKSTMQGQTFMAQEANKLGLVDLVVRDKAQAIELARIDSQPTPEMRPAE